jgi:tetratricopeptide (TPR) repeat protein
LARETLKLAAAILALAAVAPPPAALAQSALEISKELEQQVVDSINREQTLNGPHSAGLIEPLTALALLYQERGDHQLAIAIIEQLMQVVRASDGLHSLEQVPLIRQLIANEEAIGHVETAWDLEQDLLTLARRHPGDVRTVPIFRDSAEKRVDVLDRYVAGEFPPEITLGCYYGWPRGDDSGLAVNPERCIAGQKGSVTRALATDAQRYYAEAIAVLLRNELYSSNELRELEIGLLQTIELVFTYSRGGGLFDIRADREPWKSSFEAVGELARWPLPIPPGTVPLELGTANENSFDYRLGRESLERLYRYEGAALAPWVTQVDAFVRIADWDLLYSRNARAIEEYEQAYALLAERGAQESIDELFAPLTPVVLPSFLPSPLIGEETEATTGHLDVAFEITKFGESAQIEIVDMTENVTAAAADGVVESLKATRFRPRVVDGELGRARVVVRYYLAE